MDKLQFYARLADALDVETMAPETVLRDLDEWDSLAVLSVLALADASYGVTIAPEDLRAATTAADLASLVERLGSGGS